MSFRTTWRVLAAVASIATGAALVRSVAFADDAPGTRIPRVLTVGLATGPSPHDDVDLGRTRRAKDRLPTSKLKLDWTANVGEEATLLVTKDAIVAVHQDTLAFDMQGRRLWAHGGGGSPLGAPAILADGTVVVLHTDGSVAGDGSGDSTRSFHASLVTPAKEETRGAGVLPLADGGFFVHWGDTLAWFDGEGRPRDTVHASVAYRFVSTVAVVGGAAYTSTAGGAVYRIKEPAEPAFVGSFGGTVGRVVAFGADALVAVVGGERIVSMSLAGGSLNVLGRVEVGERMDGALATARGRVCGAAVLGTQVYVECFEAGKPAAVVRAAVDTMPVVPVDAGAGAMISAAMERRALIIDDSWTVAYVSPRGPVLVKDGGAALRVGPWYCSGRSPEIVPAGAGSFLTLCGREMRKYTGEFSP